MQGNWKWDMNLNGVRSSGELYLIGGKIGTWGIKGKKTYRHMET